MTPCPNCNETHMSMIPRCPHCAALLEDGTCPVCRTRPGAAGGTGRDLLFYPLTF